MENTETDSYYPVDLPSWPWNANINGTCGYEFRYLYPDDDNTGD